MKLPNGYGSCRNLGGKRRRPWICEKTVGWVTLPDGKLKQNRKIIGYYATRSEALQALASYNANPYDIDAAKITFAEIYDKWSLEKFPTISASNVHGYKASYKICEDLAPMRMADIKLEHLQRAVDNSGKNYPTLRKLKILLSQMFEYAVIHEVIPKERNLVEYVNIKEAGNPNKITREPFTKAEINKLWTAAPDNNYIGAILMLIYSGVRVSELLDLKKVDVDLTQHIFYVRQSKTEAGVRVVPIADKVYKFYEYWLNTAPECETLLSTPEGAPFLYRNFYDSYFHMLIEKLGMKHKPHDTRHTCISLLAQANINPTIIKKIVGHKGAQSLTEAVYTHLDISTLIEAINKI